MTNFRKYSVRLLAVVAVCASLSACSQSIGESANFPTYNAGSAVSSTPASTGIMELQ